MDEQKLDPFGTMILLTIAGLAFLFALAVFTGFFSRVRDALAWTLVY